MNTLLALILVGLLNSAGFAADTRIEVIPLNYRPASELIPLLAPLLGNSAQLIDNGANLLVNTTPDRLAEINALIKQLDIRQSNLIITVIQSRQTTADELNAQRRDSSKLSDSGHIYQTQDAEQNTQTIRTLEGVPAHIKAGNVYPRQNFSAYGYPTTIDYTEATTGFEITPKLLGRQVILSVAPWSDKMNGHGQIQTLNAQSTIRINLGEWVEIGGIGENSSNSNNAVITHQTSKSQTRILLKVERGESDQ